MVAKRGSSSAEAARPTVPPGRPGSGPDLGSSTPRAAATDAVSRATPRARTSSWRTGLRMARRTMATAAKTIGTAIAQPSVRSR